MKDFIQLIGDKFLTLIVLISYGIVVILGIVSWVHESFFTFLITIIIGGLLVSLIFYFIYLIIDIRDSLREIKNKIK